MSSLQATLRAAIREWRPDIIHAQSPVLVGLPALREARRHSKPLIYEVRDLWENASADRGKFGANSAAYKLARMMETRLLQRASAVVTICEKLRDELSPRVRDVNRLFVVGNGVDTEHFKPQLVSEATCKEWGLQHKQVIGYVGTFQPYEGLDILINAMPIILEQVPQAHLLIVGSGGEEPRLRAQVAASQLDSAVTFTGRLPHSQVNKMYAVADVMVYPRLLTRTTAITTPLKPLEAMAMGKAVIVSNVPAMHELVQDGKTGRMFHAGDTRDLATRCITLLGNEPDRRQLGNAARTWVARERGWPNVTSLYPDIYAIARDHRPL